MKLVYRVIHCNQGINNSSVFFFFFFYILVKDLFGFQDGIKLKLGILYQQAIDTIVMIFAFFMIDIGHCFPDMWIVDNKSCTKIVVFISSGYIVGQESRGRSFHNKSGYTYSLNFTKKIVCKMLIMTYLGKYVCTF